MNTKLKNREFIPLLSITIGLMAISGASRVWGLEPPHAFTTSAATESSALSGKRTASGLRFNPRAMTAASRTLPLGSKAIITNTKTGAKATVTITDRGPYGNAGRELDLSQAAASRIGSTHGHVKVNVVPSRLHAR